MRIDCQFANKLNRPVGSISGNDRPPKDGPRRITSSGLLMRKSSVQANAMLFGEAAQFCFFQVFVPIAL
jgi:hypothetical protein